MQNLTAHQILHHSVTTCSRALSEKKTHYTTQEIPHLLQKPRIHHHAQMRPSLNRILSKINPSIHHHYSEKSLTIILFNEGEFRNPMHELPLKSKPITKFQKRNYREKM
jgi:hypothetical protein